MKLFRFLLTATTLLYFSTGTVYSEVYDVNASYQVNVASSCRADYFLYLSTCINKKLPSDVITAPLSQGKCPVNYKKIPGYKNCVKKNLVFNLYQKQIYITDKVDSVCPQFEPERFGYACIGEYMGLDIVAEELQLVSLARACATSNKPGFCPIRNSKKVSSGLICPVNFMKTDNYNICMASKVVLLDNPGVHGLVVQERCKRGTDRKINTQFCFPTLHIETCGSEFPCEQFSGDIIRVVHDDSRCAEFGVALQLAYPLMPITRESYPDLDRLTTPLPVLCSRPDPHPVVR